MHDRGKQTHFSHSQFTRLMWEHGCAHGGSRPHLWRTLRHSTLEKCSGTHTSSSPRWSNLLIAGPRQHILQTVAAALDVQTFGERSCVSCAPRQRSRRPRRPLLPTHNICIQMSPDGAPRSAPRAGQNLHIRQPRIHSAESAVLGPAHDSAGSEQPSSVDATRAEVRMHPLRGRRRHAAERASV